MLKKFIISIIKSIIILLVATLVFSSITLDFSSFFKNVFGDIFEYSNPDVQKRVVSQLTETCSSLDQGHNVVTINQICTNKSLFYSMKENCQNYRELKRRNIEVENEEEVKESCLQIESGALERACSELEDKGSLLPDLSSIGALCKDYKAGNITDREFFFNVISSPFSDQQMQTPNIGLLDKYSNVINYLNNNKIIYFAVLLILVTILYLLIIDIKLFLLTLAGISFSIGALMIMPYLAIVAYEKFVGFDTTPILGSIFGEGNIVDFKAILSVIFLMFLRTYNSLIITFGIIFLAIGTIGKVYGFVLRRIITKKKK